MPLTFHTYTTEHEDFVLSKFPAETQEEPIPRAIVLCFTNRSGSNYLSDLLRSTGLITGLREILNWHLINKCLAENRFSSLGQFIHYQRSIDQPGARFWGFKTGWSQLLMLRQKQIIPKLVTPFFIEVRRRDKLGQAISNYIAVKTGNWSGVQSEQVSYD